MFETMKGAVLLLALCSFVAMIRGLEVPIRTVKYDGDRVFRCNAKEMTQSQLHDILTHDSADMWSERGDGTFDVRTISERNGDDLQLVVRKAGRACEIIIDDVEEHVSKFEMTMSNGPSNAGWHEAYHTYEEICTWYEELSLKYKGLMQFVRSIGNSYEGRRMPAVHIAGESRSNSSRHRIYFQCLLQGREWISGATCMYIVEFLVSNYQSNARVKKLLDSVEFVVIPIVNPDGYKYTWTINRLWWKNCRENLGTTCTGVDLSRNFNVHWNKSGHHFYACDDAYNGVAAASEPETKNIQDYFRKNFPIVGAIDWRSYSQRILRPWAFSELMAPDEARLSSLSTAMQNSIVELHDKWYTSEEYSTFYEAFGTPADWFYDSKANGGNPVRAAGFTIELRDNGTYGFLLPPSQIIPTGEEMIPAVLEFAESLNKQPLSN